MRTLAVEKGVTEIQSIDFIDTEYRGQLLGLLREKVFHVTTAKAYSRILKDGFIFANQDGKYPLNAGSLKSFGRFRGWVCLFDLRGKGDKEIDEALMRYYFLGPSWFKVHFQDYSEARLAYLLVSETYYDHLVPNREGRTSWNGGAGYTQYVPDVECWFPGKMPVQLIEKAICVRIRDSVRIDDPVSYVHHKLALKEKKMRAANHRLRRNVNKPGSR